MSEQQQKKPKGAPKSHRGRSADAWTRTAERKLRNYARCNVKGGRRASTR